MSWGSLQHIICFKFIAWKKNKGAAYTQRSTQPSDCPSTSLILHWLVSMLFMMDNDSKSCNWTVKSVVDYISFLTYLLLRSVLHVPTHINMKYGAFTVLNIHNISVVTLKGVLPFHNNLQCLVLNCKLVQSYF